MWSGWVVCVSRIRWPRTNRVGSGRSGNTSWHPAATGRRWQARRRPNVQLLFRHYRRLCAELRTQEPPAHATACQSRFAPRFPAPTRVTGEGRDAEFNAPPQIPGRGLTIDQTSDPQTLVSASSPARCHHPHCVAQVRSTVRKPVGVVDLESLINDN